MEDGAGAGAVEDEDENVMREVPGRSAAMSGEAGGQGRGQGMDNVADE